MPGVVSALPGVKTNHFGVEVVSGITWKGWEPGQEYTKNITLKNVRVKTQKVKYKVPSSRFFNTLYPQPIVLSAGTSFTLPITFRPLEKVSYEDTVSFETGEGEFAVPIHAVLPEVNIEAPQHVNCSMCAAQDFIQISFDIKNVSELLTPFQIELNEPFYVEPSDGLLEPYATVHITATFKPKAALVYEADAVIKYGTDFTCHKVTRFEGIGKYPHLLVTGHGHGTGASSSRGNIEAVVNFSEVSVGQVAEKFIELHNLSPVNAPFSIKQPLVGPSQIDKVFMCIQRKGVVPANNTIRVPVSFHPNTVGTKSIDYFHVEAIGNVSKTVVTCLGSSKGPRVHLSRNLINFLQINAGDSATKTIDVINDSDCNVSFQFQLDCQESVFKFEFVSGILGPHSKKTIILRFQPTQPINYYRKICCLIHNQAPLFVDLLGTCHTEMMKPAVLQAKHIENYQCHVDRGLSFLPPEQLNEMKKDGRLLLDADGALYMPSEGQEGPPLPPTPLQAMDEYFNDGYYSDITHTPPHVSMDIHQANFGQCTDQNSIEQQTVNITNHTKGKITVIWNGDNSHVFSVQPAMMDIPPLKSCSFRVTFNPRAPNQFFGAELECYAFFKSMRDYRLVEDHSLCPPWCLTLTATGHTFQPGNETFLPRFQLDSPKLVFPAVNTNEATYRTLLLANSGTTPILFDFEKDNTGIYSLKPTKGMLPSAQHQIFVVKILPTEVQAYQHQLRLRMNEDEKNNKEVTLSGSAEAAEVLLENNGVMYLKPTCIGTASKRQYSVKNISRIPICFEWKINNEDSRVLEVEPSAGIIQPNEQQYHTWTFKPSSQDKCIMKPGLVVWGKGQSSATSSGKKREFSLRAVGEGTVGEIMTEESYLDYGTVVVGNTCTKTFTLYNNSDCTLRYRLMVDQNIRGPYSEEQTQYDPCALELERMTGELPARCRQVINAVVRPARRVYYQWTVSYQLLPSHGLELEPSVAEPKHLCHVLATGVFPTMAVTDARCSGSTNGISKKQLWGLFSLDNLNLCLDSDPSSAELTYSTATRHSHKRRPPVYTHAILDFNFSAAPLESEPCVVQLMFENTGAVPCEWVFLFPSDLQLQLDHWAETAEFDDDELHEMKVMDNKLFQVEPNHGSLQPGDTQTVTFTYKHILAGTDRLPVLLKLARGREILWGPGRNILLNFVGVTVEPDRRYIHFPSSKYMFTPVPIGEKNSPKQIYELYNGGALPVKYEFETTPLELMKHENFDHQIFECLNPMGEVLPGHAAAIEWRFSPLEAKTYMVDVPIQIHNGDTAVVTFTGVGYDKRAMGTTMPMTDNHDLSGVPSVQSVPVPGQLCYLSQERVSFGNLPLFTRAREVVALTNNSAKHAVTFRWHVTAKRDAKILSISPSTGTLPPGKSQSCKITFTSFGFPSFSDLDIICEVTNMTEYDEYKQQLSGWEAERKRQQEEFCVTEDDPNADRRIPATPDTRPSSGTRLKSITTPRTPSPDSDLAKYKTLPPIRQTSIDQIHSSQCNQQKLNEAFWAQPQPPKPFLLHLGVTARTHNVAEFQHNFPDQYKNFYIDKSLSERTTSVVEPRQDTLSCPEEIVCTEAEADVIVAAMSNLLRGLLEDTEFQESCETVIHEPIPYYNQFLEDMPGSRVDDSNQQSTVEIRVEVMSTSIPQSAQVSTRGLEGTEADEEEEENKVDSSGVDTDRSDNSASQELESLRISSPGGITTAPSSTLGPECNSQATLPSPSDNQEETKFAQQEALKKMPEFGSVAESIIENTLLNVIQEAFRQEFNVTSRPRLVALPPRPNTPQASNSNH